MRISIAARLRPFSHQPGVRCLIPGSSQLVQIFPAFIRLYNMGVSYPQLKAELPLDIQGPVKEFTVLQDLERGGVHVWGFNAKEFMRYHLYATNGKMVIVPEKGLSGKELNTPGNIDIADTVAPETSWQLLPRLSLGSHKKQDWESLWKSANLCDILPLWLRLGDCSPTVSWPTEGKGTARLLDNFRNAIERRDVEALYELLHTALKGCFSGMLVPRWEDDDYQGLMLSQPAPQLSPIALLKEGARLITSLFVVAGDAKIELLPLLPPQFHCGRFLSLPCGDWGKIDMEWTKKSLRRCIFKADRDGEVMFALGRGLRRYRLRKRLNDTGLILAAESSVQIAKGQIYFLDKFER